MANLLEQLGPFLSNNPILLLFAVIALGFLAGEVRFPGGLRFGVAAVLFVGIAAGILWPEIRFPSIIAPLGLGLFVYCLGLQAGPGFFRSFRREGLTLSLCLIASLLVVFGGCLFLIYIMDAPPALVTGMFAGIATNTASLGGATEAALQAGADADIINELILGYALHYPIGIVITLLVINVLANKIPPAKPATPSPNRGPSFPHTFEIRTTRDDGSPWTGEALAAATQVILSRYQDAAGHIDFVRPDTELHPGTRIVAVAGAEGHNRMTQLVGAPSTDAAPLQLRWEGFEKERFFVSQRNVVGIPLRQLRLHERGVVISRIRRGDVELPISGETRLQLGDRVRVIYRTGQEAGVVHLLGNSLTTSTESGYLSFVVGIIVGMALGLLPLPVPFLDVPIRLGVAGGALMAGLILGARGRTGPLVWHLPITVNLTLRQTGLLLFLAAAGIQAGTGIESAIALADWRWLSAGIGLLLLSQLVFLFLVTRIIPRTSPSVLGSLSAMQTQPGALVLATSRFPASDTINNAYAALYPLALILKILLAQLLVLTL